MFGDMKLGPRIALSCGLLCLLMTGAIAFAVAHLMSRSPEFGRIAAVLVCAGVLAAGVCAVSIAALARRIGKPLADAIDIAETEASGDPGAFTLDADTAVAPAAAPVKFSVWDAVQANPLRC